ncbi:related to YjeF_N domain protein [Cephalotrichum gorgonifer]|uniref:Enhancer of mRNA-decapping protein 3 n=1 Tax=Cephalotrichum gorgonifer TaxID=2041049 RepID=A0AAE8SVY4_9PEZI|nr:related to YjeF_N domain protein [Cephalotrichum gorgonifer]
MASEFIGLDFLVTLREPAGLQLKGTISDITITDPVAGQRGIILSNVFVVGTQNQWYPRLEVASDNIQDLAEVKRDSRPSTFTAPAVSAVSAPVYAQPTKPVFDDPAILSVGLSKSDSTSTPQSADAPQAITSGNEGGRQPTTTAQPHTGGRITNHPSREKTPELPDAVDSLRIDSPTPPSRATPIELDGVAQDLPVQTGKKKRRDRRKAGPKYPYVQDAAGHLDSSPSGVATAPRGKGWRQTPILESTASFQPFTSLKRKGGRGNKGVQDNGWASEDVTEEMGEFDFESGLAKFDKRTLFDQMRKEDLIDESDRLVSHNRVPKPGTMGGKNLHFTENVLDSPSSLKPPLTTANDFWNSEADDGPNVEERGGGRDARSSQSSRRADSKSGVARKSQSRKTSVAPGGYPLSRVNSGPRQQIVGSDGVKYQLLQRVGTPKQAAPQPGLYLVPSNRRVEPVSALQMLNLENIAANEIGLTEDVMTENAGRGIAEVTLRVLNDPAISVRIGTSGRSTPLLNPASHATVVILAGNNKSGIRAIAAGRHLRSKGANVMVCLVGIERERELLEDMRQQVRVYRNLGGRIFNKAEFFDHLRKTAAGTAPTTVSLVIDALLGLTISFEELRTGDQASVYELMEWANRNEAFVLAVDVPTGVDPTSGKVNIIDGSRLFVKPRYVVAMGAPKRGLLEAISPDNEEGAMPGSAAPEGTADDEEWKLYIADIGLGPGVWKKGGTRMRRGIDFDDRWVLEMRYEGGGIAE